MTVEKPKPKQLHRPITTGTNSVLNQSEFLFLAITCNAQEKSRVHGAIGFGFASHWLKNWRESFKPITKRRNRYHVITFDSHLKTALSISIKFVDCQFVSYQILSPVSLPHRHGTILSSATKPFKRYIATSPTHQLSEMFFNQPSHLCRGIQRAVIPIICHDLIVTGTYILAWEFQVQVEDRSLTGFSSTRVSSASDTKTFYLILRYERLNFRSKNRTVNKKAFSFLGGSRSIGFFTYNTPL